MPTLATFKIELRFGWAILILLVATGITYRALVLTDDSEQWVEHTDKVVENLQRFHLAIVQSLLACHQFVSTADESQLAAWRVFKQNAGESLQSVRSLTLDNAEQQRRVAALKILSAQEIQFATTVIGLRQAKGLAEARHAMQSRQDIRILEQLEQETEQARQQELRLLVGRRARSKLRLDETKALLILGAVLGMLIGTLATVTVHRENVRRLRAEAALQENEQRFRSLLDAAPDPMVVVNHQGQIVLLNVQAEKQFGYPREELLNQPIEILIPERLRSQHPDHRTNYVAHPRVRAMGAGIELLARRRDGSEFPTEIMLSPMESSAGLLTTAAIRDITERKETMDRLAATAGELQQSNIELQQFAYVASHDLQEPLRMVTSYTQLLAKRYQGRLDAEADEFIAYAVDGCQRMQALIQDLLCYSRAGSKEKHLSPISSQDVLATVLSNMKATIVECRAAVTHDALPLVMADDTQLSQLFQNLIGNAIKYCRDEDPQVHISAAKNGGNEWRFSVQDNGIGIEPQYFEKIFLLFQRLHGRQEYAGTGIGLAICKKIVERMGGRIWVDSVPGKGSTFYFTLFAGGLQWKE